jgi:hypothetical protein
MSLKTTKVILLSIGQLEKLFEIYIVNNTLKFYNL